eukprot:jgi/Bigna1/91604/estExt_fgenesh1_pg.C_1080038
MSEKSKASPSPPPLSRQMALALVCNSNVNRSLEGHRILKEKGFGRVWSYGVGSKVRLPGIRGPSVYMFGTPFEAMQRDLENKNYNWYKDRGILDMLDRDAKVKKAPRRWQDEKKRNYDLILAYDIRAYNILIEVGMWKTDTMRLEKQQKRCTNLFVSSTASKIGRRRSLPWLIRSLRQITKLKFNTEYVSPVKKKYHSRMRGAIA